MIPGKGVGDGNIPIMLALDNLERSHCNVLEKIKQSVADSSLCSNKSGLIVIGSWSSASRTTTSLKKVFNLQYLMHDSRFFLLKIIFLN